MASISSLPAELLGYILEHLSMKDLLLDQRVCRQWRQVIKQSPHLQRLMFLGFVPSTRLSPTELSRFVHDNKHASGPSTEKQKSQASLNEKEHLDEDQDAVDNPAKSPSGPVVSFNPVFPSEGEVIRMRTMQFRAKLSSAESWLNMYLTQMPCSHVEATVYWKRSSASGFRIFGRKTSDDTATCLVNVEKANGVRARDVLSAARDCQVCDIKKWQRIDIRVPGIVRG
ncbi:hypothetical protein M409DRAFT_24512 [Zasmidium cellare ATCC 36951]|uniref:F-box domain-containing protein n=1 Tax=Zasmidium cellare ATCC 36951 TaxID=1080233 RepID=A0A6A6CD57_ZASCE|nr:uncharacterized protein M409DRAFT_24512 [Zasmidium cellare ATCC 36951]KAF2165124.1 hypothetical protein M409DRAFT_24512 [Zasmidium cellare ATCC 36951]